MAHHLNNRWKPRKQTGGRKAPSPKKGEPAQLLKKGGHAPPFASRSEFARLIPRGRALCALRSAFTLPPIY